MLKAQSRKGIAVHVGQGREMMETMRQRLREEDFAVPIAKLYWCPIFPPAYGVLPVDQAGVRGQSEVR